MKILKILFRKKLSLLEEELDARRFFAARRAGMHFMSHSSLYKNMSSKQKRKLNEEILQEEAPDLYGGILISWLTTGYREASQP